MCEPLKVLIIFFNEDQLNARSNKDSHRVSSKFSHVGNDVKKRMSKIKQNIKNLVNTS